MFKMDSEPDSVSIATYFNDICRLCLNKGQLQILGNLQGEYVITVVSLLEVLLNRKLPETICEQCFKELSQIALFIRKCKHSQNILQQIEAECAKIQTTNNIRIEILDMGQPQEVVICSPDTLLLDPEVAEEEEADYENTEYLQTEEDHIDHEENRAEYLETKEDHIYSEENPADYLQTEEDHVDSEENPAEYHQTEEDHVDSEENPADYLQTEEDHVDSEENPADYLQAEEDHVDYEENPADYLQTEEDHVDYEENPADYLEIEEDHVDYEENPAEYLQTEEDDIDYKEHAAEYLQTEEDDVDYKENAAEYHQTDKDHVTLQDSFCTNTMYNDLDLQNCESQDIPISNDVKVNTTGSKICDKCGLFVTTMMVHYKESKSCRPKNMRCTECDMCFAKTEQLRDHTIAHHWKETHPRFMCHICAKMFKYEVNLGRHLKVHELGKRFSCEECGKSYTTKIVLKDHMNTHTGDRPFSCSFCGKTFTTRSMWSVHEKKHRVKLEVKMDKEKFDSGPVFCDICNRKCAHLNSLSLHRLSHDENRMFPCTTCHAEFPSKLSLLRHYTTHQENLYQCSYCLKSFRIRAYLRTHMRIHTGERPYVCNLCPKRFTQTAHLHYHKLLHKNVKAFVCKYCNKSFTLKGNLTVHLRIHTGERPYKCHVCGNGFRDSSGRKRHVVSKHGEEQVPFIKSIDVNEL